MKKSIGVRFIRDQEHYEVVLSAALNAKKFLWLGTSDMKDLYVQGNFGKPGSFLNQLAALIKKGVSVRLAHAKEPGIRFREDFDANPVLIDGLERVLCPRVHFKIIIIDGVLAYVGSANLTGAGIGMKSERNRNFEAGIFTDDAKLVYEAMESFDALWRGERCHNCGRKEFCLDPIV